MFVSIQQVGLTNSAEDINNIIILHLLDIGELVSIETRVDYPSEIEGSRGTLRVYCLLLLPLFFLSANESSLLLGRHKLVSAEASQKRSYPIGNRVGKMLACELHHLIFLSFALHLNAHTAIKALHQTFVSRGHDVTRSPMDWMLNYEL